MTQAISVEDQADASTADDRMSQKERMSQRERVAPLVRSALRLRGGLYVAGGAVGLLAASGGRALSGGAKLSTVTQHPLGVILLFGLAVGLSTFATWRLIQAVFDLQKRGRSARSIFGRLGLGLSALAHAGLSFVAMQMLLHPDLSDPRSLAFGGWIMSVPFHRFWVLVAGVLMVLAGISQLLRARSGSVVRDLNLSSAHRSEHGWLINLSRAGQAAQGIAFGLIGGYMVKGANSSLPGEIKGIAPALKGIASGPIGASLLIVIALGLIAYGVVEILQTKYRKLPA